MPGDSLKTVRRQRKLGLLHVKAKVVCLNMQKFRCRMRATEAAGA